MRLKIKLKINYNNIKRKMNITLYEKVNRERLNEVLECTNLPFNGDEKSEYKISFITKLKNYSKKKLKNGKIEITYKQPNKWGRFYSGNGFQGFKKDVRKYLNNENDLDIDIVNCHPVILQQLFMKYKIDCGEQLREYNLNRNEFINKYSLKDKLDFIKMINNDILKNEIFKETHDLIYEHLLPKLIKENKPVYDRIKKSQTKKGYNINGSFFSSYLQELENRILMSMYSFFNEKGFTVSSLCFDGCMVEKHELLNEKLLKEIEKRVFTDTKYKIELSFKSMKTDWKPIKCENFEIEVVKPYSNQFSTETYDFLSIVKEEDEEGKLVVNDDKKQKFIDYSNKYMCKFEDPPCYGFRFNTDDVYNMCENAVLVDNTIKEGLFLWKRSDNKLQYKRSIFEVNEKLVDNNEYNKYQRPIFKETNRTLKEISPLYYDFLYRVICDSDNSKYNYIVNLNAKILQVGQSQQAVVLQGIEGCGKSSFVFTVIELNGRLYSSTVNNVSHLTKDFNAIFETKIITEVSEISGNAGDFHNVANTFKDLIDNPFIRIEPKGINPYMRKTMNNFFITGNGVNSFYVSNNNRRVAILEVKPYEKGNMQYFSKMKKEFIDNIEEIRGYFYKYKYTHNLALIRPITEEELVLVELNKTPVDMFIDEMRLSIEQTSHDRILAFQFQLFLDFCKNNKYKDTSKKYFSAQLNKRGFVTKQLGKQNRTYIVGITDETIDVESDNDIDDIDSNDDL